MPAVADHHLPRELRALLHDLLLAALRLLLGPVLRPRGASIGPRGLQQLISGRSVYLSTSKSELEGDTHANRCGRARRRVLGMATHAAFSSPAAAAAAAEEPIRLARLLLACAVGSLARGGARRPLARSDGRGAVPRPVAALAALVASRRRRAAAGERPPAPAARSASWACCGRRTRGPRRCCC